MNPLSFPKEEFLKGTLEKILENLWIHFRSNVFQICCSKNCEGIAGKISKIISEEYFQVKAKGIFELVRGEIPVESSKGILGEISEGISDRMKFRKFSLKSSK